MLPQGNSRGFKVASMGLVARVRCTCIREGRAKLHPFPDRLIFDQTGDPMLSGEPSEKNLTIQDKWFADSCEHGGHLVATFLGNIGFVGRLRELVRHLEGDPAPRFPVLLKHVIYEGTHTGAWIPSTQAKQLLTEVDSILHSRDILSETEQEFFSHVRNLSLASIETGYPIVF